MEQETVKLDITQQEAFLINNVLVENALSTVQLVSQQTTEESFNQARAILQSGVMAQQAFFTCICNGSLEMHKRVGEFIRVILQSAVEQLEGLKEELIKEGDEMGFQVAENHKLLLAATEKFPEKSLIVTP